MTMPPPNYMYWDDIWLCHKCLSRYHHGHTLCHLFLYLTGIKPIFLAHKLYILIICPHKYNSDSRGHVAQQPLPGAYILIHYDDVIMTMLASQITSLTVVYSIVYSGVNQRKHQSSASLAFVREIHRGPVNFPHKWPVTRKMFPFDDVIMTQASPYNLSQVGHP